MTSRIFLIESVDEDRFNLESAEEYGEIISLTIRGEKRPPLYSDEYNEWLAERLKFLKYDGEHDIFLICGNLLTIAKAVSVISQLWENFQALGYNARTGKYELILLGLESASISN